MGTNTKAEHAYASLRRAIVVGEVAANTPLDEADLVTRLGTGRTPIREALKRLAMEQFIVWPAHRTPYVREVGAQELSRLYEARLLLEEPTARIAATRIGANQLRDLDLICDRMEEAAEVGKVYEAVELDHQLHLGIARGSDNRFLAEAVDNLNCGSLRLWYLSHQEIGLEKVPQNHRTILDALRSRDPDRAAEATRQHILNSLDRQLRRQSLDYATPAQ